MLARSFDLRPLGEVILGGRTFSVPPLTFGRFNALLATDTAALVSHYAGLPETEKGEEMPFDPGPLTPLVVAVVPGLDAETWRKHATPQDAAKLFLLFAKGHDWQMIADAIDFGKLPEKGERPPSKGLVMAGLLALAQQSGVSVAELMDVRVEGFYSIAEGVKARNEMTRATAEPESREIPMGLGRREDGGAGLMAMMEAADRG